MQFKQLFFIFYLFFFCATLQAQELLPFVENFTKSEYNGDNQVWNVVQGSDKAMYFANNHYFLRYNGVKWEKYALPNKTIIRSVFVDGDKIYCGSYKEFGYWKRINGSMKYFSLSAGKNLFGGNADNEEIWKIFKHHNTLYFQAFNEIYIVNGDKAEKVKLPTQISYCYIINDTIYVATVRQGIYTMRDKKFSRVEGWLPISDNIIHGMESHNGQTYIFTKNNGVYLGNENAVKPWDSPINDLLKHDVISTAKFLGNNELAIGTGLKGLYIVNLADGSFRNINRGNSLKNNAILSLTLDSEKDLWLGLDNGISHVEINSPVTLLTDNSGLLGSVYSLSTTDKGYLLVTNHGIFTYANSTFDFVPNSRGQVWDVYKNGSEFIIGHNDGTFVYNGAGLIRVNPVNGGWKFLKSVYDNVYFQANYTGIAVYKDINNLADWKKLNGLTKPIKNIAQSKPGELWAADNYRSLYRITYDAGFNVKKIENVSAANHINSDFGVKIFNFRNEVLFLINNSWYVYNSISGKLEKNNLFNTAFNGISDIIPVDDDNFVVIKNGLLYTVSQVNNQFVWKLLPDKYYQGRLIMENTQVHKDGNMLLINLDDGFMSFNPLKEKAPSPKITIEGFYQGRLIDSGTKIKYNQPVEINVISPYFGYNRAELFYVLNSNKNYVPVKNGNIILNNLASGLQELKVYNYNGVGYTQVAEYEFHIAQPWYFSWWMILIYIVFVSLIFFFYYRWNKVRYMEKIKLNEEELKHRREILELEMEAENKLIQQEYEKHRLEAEVQNKASEVAGKSLSIAKHSEMIESIQEALEQEENNAQLKSRIKKIIKTNSISKNEWQSFEKNLVKSHEEFVDRLSKQYPALTSKDIKLCIYLRMNLSSKEIAPLMNISFRGVELHRYRLRKKIELPQEENLSKFMMTL